MLTITINECINRALNLIGEYAPNETPQQRYFVIGQQWANLILARWSSSGITIPFVDTLSFDLEANKTDYTIGPAINPAPDIVGPRILSIIGAHIEFGGLDYGIDPMTDFQYFGGTRNNSIVARPNLFLLTNDRLKSTITFYPKPDQVYKFVMRFKGQFDSVIGQSQLIENPDIYNELLIFELGFVLSMEFPTALWDEKRQRHLEMLRGIVTNTNYVDMTVNLSSICARPYGRYFLRWGGWYW